MFFSCLLPTAPASYPASCSCRLPPGSSVDVEVVFEDDVLRDRVAVLLRGAELDLPRGFDGLLRQSVGQTLDHTDARHLARSRQHGADSHESRHVVLARVLGESRLRLERDDGLARHLVLPEGSRVVNVAAATTASRPAAAEVRVAAADVVAAARPHPRA